MKRSFMNFMDEGALRFLRIYLHLSQVIENKQANAVSLVTLNIVCFQIV